MVTYAVVDAQTGSMLSSHRSFDAARAELPQAACDHPGDVAIYVFDDTGHVAGYAPARTPCRRLTAALAALLTSRAQAGAAVPFHDLGDPAGPLTRVAAGADLSCQAQHIGDPAFEFAARVGARRLRHARRGRRPALRADFAAHDGTGTAALGAYTPYARAARRRRRGRGRHDRRPARQRPARSCSATRTCPARTPTAPTSRSATPARVTKSIVLYRAGDCHLQGPGTGYGFAGSPDGSAGCAAQPGNAPLDRVIQWVPITGGEHLGPGQRRRRLVADRRTHAVRQRVPRVRERVRRRRRPVVGASTSRRARRDPLALDRLLPRRPHRPAAAGRAAARRAGRDDRAGHDDHLHRPDRLRHAAARYRLRVTSVRKKRISKRPLRLRSAACEILRVEFFVDAERRLTDKRAAFKALLPSAGAAPGEHALAARVLLQPLREKRPPAPRGQEVPAHADERRARLRLGAASGAVRSAQRFSDRDSTGSAGGVGSPRTLLRGLNNTHMARAGGQSRDSASAALAHRRDARRRMADVDVTHCRHGSSSRRAVT